jgi:hypothetical protein
MCRNHPAPLSSGGESTREPSQLTPEVRLVACLNATEKMMQKVIWKAIDEADYDDALGMLPPAKQTGNGFLLGEAATHRTCEVDGKVKSTFAAFIHKGDRFYKADRPLTSAEFVQVSIHPDLPQ